MGASPTFDEVLDAVEALSDEMQSNLTGIVRHRLSARRREHVLTDVFEARREHAEGWSRPASVVEIMQMTESATADDD